MVDGFVTLFTETDIVGLIVLGVSLVCLIAEVFIPSFGLVGIGGLILAVAGIVFCVLKPWLTVVQIIWIIVDILVIFAVVILAVKFGFFLWKKSRGEVQKKRKKQFLEIDGKKVPADDVGNPDFSYLKGKAGVCTTDLNPAGKVEIDGEIFDVHSQKGYLYTGNMVRVTKTVGAIIYVQKIQS
ncbi:MAG: hypothetical protein IJW24_03510 [Clostridia bacterium]|nr:hypothetical protein [Clostridia bacterium]